MDSGDVLAGRTVLITGSTGIAARTAELAAGSGARVFVTSRTPEHGEELARRIGCTFIPADLTAPDAAERVVRQVGALDALFNVAGRKYFHIFDVVVAQLNFEFLALGLPLQLDCAA